MRTKIYRIWHFSGSVGCYVPHTQRFSDLGFAKVCADYLRVRFPWVSIIILDY